MCFTVVCSVSVRYIKCTVQVSSRHYLDYLVVLPFLNLATTILTAV